MEIRVFWALLGCLGCLALLNGNGKASMAAEPRARSACWRDYPVATKSTDYKASIASGALVPSELVVNGQRIHYGMTEQEITKILRIIPSAAGEWTTRDSDEQCEYLLNIVRAHPDDMHLYTFGAVSELRLAGLFRAVEWRLDGIGTLRVHMHRASDAASEASYFHEVLMRPVPRGTIASRKRSHRVFKRTRKPTVEWNVDTNTLAFDTQHPSR
ncbi:MAG: hypothetical protein H6729_15995 [Deltaproteobacteria bacterium]|nr:hypothetical protein [Deltaproteobacteria bacterium]